MRSRIRTDCRLRQRIASLHSSFAAERAAASADALSGRAHGWQAAPPGFQTMCGALFNP
jgi:hypothetical protein